MCRLLRLFPAIARSAAIRSLAVLAGLGMTAAALAQPANDNFATATVISNASGTISGDNLGATFETGESSHNCVNPDPGGSSIWFQWTAPSDGLFSFDTIGSGLDTVLAVYTGTSVSNLTSIGCNDDISLAQGNFQSRFSFTAVGGTVYYIAVDGYFGQQGTIVLNWRTASGITLEGGTFQFTKLIQFVSEDELTGAAGPTSSARPAMASITRVLGSAGRMLVNYTVTNDWYTQIAQTNRSGTNVYTTNVVGGVTTFVNTFYTNYAVIRTHRDVTPANGFFTCFERFSYFTAVTNDNGTITTTNSPLLQFSGVTAPCRNQTFVTNNAPTNFVTTEIHCINIVSNNLVPAAIPFLDYIPDSGTLTFVDYQMRADIPVFVLPNDPDYNVNRTVLINIDSVAADAQELPDIGVPQINPDRASTFMNIMDVDAVNNDGTRDAPSCGTNADFIVNFSHYAFTIGEAGGGAEIWLEHTGTNLMGGGTASVRADWLASVNNFANDYFGLMDGSDYAIPNNLADPLGYARPDADFGGGQITLTWPGGDFTPKGLVVPIFDDATPEFNEDLFLEIYASSGKIGYINTCNLTIFSDDQPAGAADNTHNQDDVDLSDPPHNLFPGANGTVFALAVQGDGKTVLAGNFSAFNAHPRARIARMLGTGQIDTAFDPGSGANDFISCLALQTDGKIMVGGNFNSFNGTGTPRIARLDANGARDATFNPGFGLNGTVWAVAVQPDNKVIVAGEFGMADIYTRHFIARLNADGSVDTTFDPGTGPNGKIFAIALQGDGSILIGGEFTSVNGTSRNHVARLTPSGSLDTTFDPAAGANGTVYAVALFGSKIFIGGAFSHYNLISRKSVARLNFNGSLDLSFDTGTGANDTVYCVLPQADGRIYIGGLLTSYNKTRRMGFARINADGILDTTFMDTAYNHFAGLPKSLYNPSVEPNSFIFTCGLQPDGNVLVGGGFSVLGAGGSGGSRTAVKARQNIARLVGGSTPGPGSISLATTNITTDENGLTAYIRLNRDNGQLGPASAIIGTVDQQPGPGAAISGTDYIFDAATYSKPLWETSWGYNWSWMLSDGITGPNNNETWIDPSRNLPQPLKPGDDVYINIIDNTNIDGNRSFDVEIAQPITEDFFFLGGAYAGTAAALANPLQVDGENIPLGVAVGRTSTHVTIVDNDVPHGVITFKQADYFVNEDGTNAVITVLRTNGSAGLVSVQYTATSGSATAGAEFVSVSNTLTFPAGVVSNVFLVPLINDSTVEDDETVNLRLLNVTGGGAFGLTNATLTIIDNDFPAGRLNFSVTNFTVSENAGQATITVTRTGGSKNALSVQYLSLPGTATPGVDYANVAGTLNWANGDTLPKSFTIPITNDVVVEGPETINLRLLNASSTGAIGSRSNAVLTIVDDDFLGTVEFSANAYSFPENGGAVTITVIRTGGSSEAVAVNFATSDFDAVAGVHYSPTNGTLSFGPGEISKTFTVPLIDNPLPDGDRRLTLSLFGASPTNGLGFPQTVFLTILDDELHNEPAGSPDTTFTGTFNGDVFALALQTNGKILAGGDFTFAGDTPRNRVARLNVDGSVDGTFMKAYAGADNTVRTMVEQTDGRLLIGGFFTNVNGVILNRIARLNGDGSLDSLFNPGAGADNPVYAMAETFTATGRKLVVGGAFVGFAGATWNHLVQLNDNGTVDGTFNIGSQGLDGTIYALAVCPTNSLHAGKILIGGEFLNVNGTPRPRIARLNPDGSLDASFNALGGPNDSVRAIAIQSDGRILIGGLFTNVNGVFLNHIARLNADGSVDNTFTPGVGANDLVHSIAIQSDTRILLGGQFTRASGVTRGRITRLNANGTVDPMINFGAGANNFVSSVLLQTNDMILIAGGFTEYDGESLQHIARLYGGAIAGSGQLQFTTSEFFVNENATNGVVTVRRRGGTSGQTPGASISVDAFSYNGTATNGVHFIATTNALVFPEGEVFASFNVPIIDDFIVNEDRYVNLGITNIAPAGSADYGVQPTARLNIINDDSAISFSTSTFTVSENTVSGYAAITINRFGSILGDATIGFSTTTNGSATPGQDYVPVTNLTVTFTNGETQKTVVIPIVNDLLVEGDETVTLMLTNPVGAFLLAPSTATLIIVDNDVGPGQIAFSAPTYGAGESSGAVAVTLIRTNGRTGFVTARLVTSDGSAVAGFDYTALNQAVAFADGETNKSILIPILSDSFVEGNETFSVTLTNPTGGATLIGPATVPVTIIDDDVGFSFSAPAYAVSEAGPSITIPVLRLGGSNGVMTVHYSTTNGTATAGSDYTAAGGTLVFNDGEVFKTITILVQEDTLVEGDESFGVVLSSPSSGAQLLNSSATVTILDNDTAVGFASPTFTVDESGTNAVITLMRTNANTGAMTVGFASSNITATAGSDYSAVGGQLTFTNGESVKNILVPIINDTQVEGDETFSISLFNPGNGAQLISPSTTVVTIVDNDAGIKFSSPSYSVSEGGVQAVITVLRTTVTNSTVAVNYSTTDGTATNGADYLSVSGTLVFTNGETSKTFNVPIIDDTVEEGFETVLLSLSSPTGQVSLINPNSAVLTIVDNDGGSIVPAGVLLTAENISVNGAIDPGETVTGLFAMRNISGINTTNLTATLLVTNGVSSPSGPQNYGALVNNGASVSRPFTFTANGTNGSTILATFQVQDGATSLGRVTFAFLVGSGTVTYSNSAGITIVDNAAASPYPATINVSGLPGIVTKVTATVSNLSHAFPDDIDMLLVGPTAANTILMSDVGGNSFVTNLTLTFDDAAATSLPDSTVLSSGTNKPTNFLPDTFPAPAPPPPFGSALSVFNSTDPNGVWALYVMDDLPGGSGSIANGWKLTITTAGVIPAASDLSLKFTTPPDPAIVGSNLTYTIVVTNHGPWAATGVVMTNAIPPSAGFVSASPSIGSISTNSGAVVWNIGTLNKDAVATATVVLRPGIVGSAVSVAAVAGAQSDPNFGNNVVTNATSISPLTADLAVSVVDSPDPVIISTNSTLVYTIVVTNIGPATAPDVGVTNTLPPNVPFLSATPGGYSVAGNVVTFPNLGSINSGGQVTASITVRPLVSDTLTNTTVCGSPTVFDPLKGNNTVSIKTIVQTPPMSIGRSGNNIVIAWPLDGGNYVLERTTSLASPIVWTQVFVPAPVTVGNQRTVTLPLGAGPEFFRLRGTGP